MKYKTLNTKEALSLCDNLNKAPKGTRLVFDQPLHIKENSEGTKVFALGNDFLFTGEDSAAITAGLAHIEVPEPEPAPANPFDHPAFEGWRSLDEEGRVLGDGTTPAMYFLYCNGDGGHFHWSNGRLNFPMIGNPTLADNLPEAGEIINRLAPVAPAEVVAAAVVAFVRSKEAGT